VCTPAVLGDIIARHAHLLSLAALRYVVVDEADFGKLLTRLATVFFRFVLLVVVSVYD
jgi:hypothetical protein